MKISRKLKKDRDGVSGAIIVVAVVIVAALIAVALFGGFGAKGDGGMNMTATVYVKNLSTGEIVSGDIDMSNPSGTEQMMMSFGMGTRDTPLTMEFTQTIPKVDTFSSYAVWASCAIDYQVTGIQKGQIFTQFTAKDGSGTQLRTDNIVSTLGTISTATVDNIPLSAGSYVIANMDPAKAFSYRNVDLSGATPQNGHAGDVPDGLADSLLGVYVSNTVIHVEAYVHGWSTGSTASDWDVSASATGDLRIIVDQTTGSITAQVSSMWSSGTGWTPA